MRSPLWLLAAPCAIPVAAYVVAGSFWTALFIAMVIVTAGALSAAYHVGGRNVELRGALGEREDDVADLSAALAEATATLADARVVIPLRPVPLDRPDLRVIPPQRRSDSWLEEVMDEQARLGEQQEGGA